MKEIELSNGGIALCDDEDYGVLLRHKWRKMQNRNVWYVVTSTGKTSKISMHRFVMGSRPGNVIDHINHNGLDNQKQNLRFCTASHNTMNSLKMKGTRNKYKGVHQLKNRPNRWSVYINANNTRHFVGYFDSEIKAALAYNDAAIKYHGQFAYLNTLPNAKGGK